MPEVADPPPERDSPQVFVSFKSDDERKAYRLVRALEKAGLTVWWDRHLLSGEGWRDQIQDALDRAKCVVVVWTRASVGPAGDFVRDEAQQAKARGILVPVTMQRIKGLPLGFGELQSIDLVGWTGSTANPFFKDLVAAVRAKIAGAASPTPKGPLQRAVRRVVATTSSSAVLLGVFAFAADAFSIQKEVCSIGVVQPAVSDACGAVGLGGRPTRTERLAWQDTDRNNCEQLRAHAQRFPEGAYHGIASDRIETRTVSHIETWKPATKRLPVFEIERGEMSPTVADAQEKARLRAGDVAVGLCRTFGATTTYRIKTVTLEGVAECTSYNKGHLCSFDGMAVCDVEMMSVTEVESCAATR